MNSEELQFGLPAATPSALLQPSLAPTGTARIHGVQPGDPTPPGSQRSEPALHPSSARLLNPGAAPPKGEQRRGPAWGGAVGGAGWGGPGIGSEGQGRGLRGHGSSCEFTAGIASHSLAV